MTNTIFKIPEVRNEPVLSYMPGSKERQEVKDEIARLKSIKKDIYMVIDGERIVTRTKKSIHPPHELRHTLGYYYKGNKDHVKAAIDASLRAKASWENMPWQERAAIFLRAADLIAGPYRAQTNAMTMLGQSKNIFQSEIHAEKMSILNLVFLYNCALLYILVLAMPHNHLN